MAVEPQTVYEATNYGEEAGLFTITTAREMKGNWVGDGKWKPYQPLDEKLARDAAKAPKPKVVANPDDERPILRRPGSSSSPSGDASGKPAASSPASGSGTASASSKSSPDDDDPNRPTLKKPSEPAPATDSSDSSASSGVVQIGRAKPTTPPPSENDPNRPLLRRGKQEPQSSTPEPAATATSETHPSSAAPPPTAPGAPADNKVRRSFPAISDAAAFETRSLLYSMNAEERANKSDQMRALAMSEIGKFIATRHTPALPKGATISDYDLRSYDLDYSNTPTIVLTAKLPVAGAKAFRGSEFDYFVTVVAREDVSGAPIKIFSSVSDSNHLDAFPSMEIIDAVDADANGRGDLLFRQYSDTGVSYSLYRVFPYAMQKVFEGGSGV
jgi:hypothetical protein